MLDSTTKKRIDNCRDILVGKVPDPKSQIEQITIALIYKFMDDMDREAVELGGKRQFFSQEFKKYEWPNLFSKELSGEDRVKLYAEAIEKMDENPGIPQLFRDIFKNAFLPYRDPETLREFLKYINEFQYDHSEKLGDAFEYLLSVLGSQGDAGQFRTPRHIIDFMVELVDPKKTDTILDPACGTAGFLISAYKHIVKQNSGNFNPETNPHTFEQHNKPASEISFETAKRYKGDKLSPDQRKKLVQNIKGYDISPDMVRMSLVNMYLHGFPEPHIYEYDTLTSEDRWGEKADVILANPPFMSPKGGIRPHKRFGVSSNRSEVLFVDYIAEHLSPKGRAAIVVPEGIVFQSGTAYKALRKMLVEENYLVGVISLPAGVFNPYSGVKTSILWLDRELAAKTDNILFAKVTADGFDLGAQRRPIKQNDLPGIFEEVTEYKAALENDGVHETCGNSHLVSKVELGKNGDYNFSGDRYKINNKLSDSKWPLISLSQCCEIYNGSTPSKSNPAFWSEGDIPWFTIEDVRTQGRIIKETKQYITRKGLNETSVKLLPKQSVLLCCTASVGEYAFSEIELTTNQQFNGLVVKEEFKGKLLPKFLFLLASTFKSELIRLSGKTSFNFVSVGTLKTLQIPLPPLSVQVEFVAEIEGYQNEIEDFEKKVIQKNMQINKCIESVWHSDHSVQNESNNRIHIEQD